MKVKHALLGTAASLMVAIAAMAHPYGMGPGFMGGGGGDGYGMGPRMMGGYGSGAAMMWGAESDAYASLHLSGEQRQKITDIREETSKAMWQLMGTMRQGGDQMHRMFAPGALDEQGARDAYERMSATQKAMFDLRLDARRKIEAVLTKEQREQLRGASSGR